ncbi:peptidoglycan binding domain-containing protein [Niallia sp. Krafla_26]
MENAVKESFKESGNNQKKSSRWFTNWKWMLPAIIIVIALIIGVLSYYQATHFNSNVTINGIQVGGLTKDEALDKLKTSVLQNKVYIGDEEILDGKDTNSGFTDKDLLSIQNLFKEQQTVFPTSKEQNLSLSPSNPDPYRIQDMKKEVETKLTEMNKSLTPPQDAQARLENGQIVIANSVDGKQYDIVSLMNEYDKQGFASEIRLDPVFIEPVKEDSEIIKNGEARLQELLQHTVEYKVQDTVHSLKGNELIQNAFVTHDMKVTIDPELIQNKIAEINDAQSTLDKDFTFKTHSGNVISVKGQGYGWALDVEKETTQVQQAFENGDPSVSASHIKGHGWSGEGYGYGVTANNGIGNNYAEVSIAEQRVWIYREGKMVFTTNVVTGNHNTNEDTSKGVWYVLYKRTPYVLNGSRAGSSEYSIKVNYWVPFTNSGQGFHDASWRSNWSSNAYISNGSGGCVNVQPSLMKNIYDNLNTYDPVVVY